MLTHDLRSIPQYARKVEAMGYDCLWSSETQHDPYLPLAVAATSTERIKLGTAIAVAFPRSPMITAYIAWDLQKASGGRMRSEEHTSELQSHSDLVCRLLLEKKTQT